MQTPIRKGKNEKEDAKRSCLLIDCIHRILENLSEYRMYIPVKLQLK
jgi:hypothetical protein